LTTSVFCDKLTMPVIWLARPGDARVPTTNGGEAMSANLAVERWYSGMNSHDADVLLEVLHPEVEMIIAEGFPSGGRHVGPDAIFDDLFVNSFSNWHHIRPEAEEYIEAGDVIVVRCRYLGVTRDTNTPFDVPAVHVWRIADGQLRWMQQYIDTAVLQDAIAGRSRGAATAADASIARAARPQPASGDLRMR
jgi:ketosteroid isomerase-like protein